MYNNVNIYNLTIMVWMRLKFTKVFKFLSSENMKYFCLLT